jgi:hypothetical protein
MTDNALLKGIEVEREHKKTYDWLKELFEAGESFPDEDEFFGMIASDHLDEFEDYYDRLEKMEKGE